MKNVDDQKNLKNEVGTVLFWAAEYSTYVVEFAFPGYTEFDSNAVDQESANHAFNLKVLSPENMKNAQKLEHIAKYLNNAKSSPVYAIRFPETPLFLIPRQCLRRTHYTDGRGDHKTRQFTNKWFREDVEKIVRVASMNKLGKTFDFDKSLRLKLELDAG